jgi:septal ring factor EnvC (AmiA/AmiB activator)
MFIASLLACGALFLPPVNGVVVRAYEPPSCTYCAGHRGVSVAVVNGTPVRAIADGVITFAGQVGGNLFVVLKFGVDLRLTYGYLTDRMGADGNETATGDVVARGEVLGRAGSRVYLGVRRGVHPVNPLPFVGGPRARLVLPGTSRC